MILIYADVGALPLDVSPARAISYVIDADGELVDDRLATALGERLQQLRRESVVDSPLFQLLQGFPGIDLPHDTTETSASALS